MRATSTSAALPVANWMITGSVKMNGKIPKIGSWRIQRPPTLHHVPQISGLVKKPEIQVVPNNATLQMTRALAVHLDRFRSPRNRRLKLPRQYLTGG